MFPLVRNLSSTTEPYVVAVGGNIGLSATVRSRQATRTEYPKLLIGSMLT
jgi:hypothetical protein